MNKQNIEICNSEVKFYSKKIFGYKRLGLIDSGTYGKVFKVRNFKFKKLYACKEIKLSEKKMELIL